jgi:hypothetical protein
MAFATRESPFRLQRSLTRPDAVDRSVRCRTDQEESPAQYRSERGLRAKRSGACSCPGNILLTIYKQCARSKSEVAPVKITSRRR